MAVGDIIDVSEWCTRPNKEGKFCYCDSQVDVACCPYATKKHKAKLPEWLRRTATPPAP